MWESVSGSMLVSELVLEFLLVLVSALALVLPSE